MQYPVLCLDVEFGKILIATLKPKKIIRQLHKGCVHTVCNTSNISNVLLVLLYPFFTNS